MTVMQTINTISQNEAETKPEGKQEQQQEHYVPVDTIRAYYALSIFARPVIQTLV